MPREKKRLRQPRNKNKKAERKKAASAGEVSLLIILASRFDSASARLAERWAPVDARLLTPADLSRPGWRDNSGGRKAQHRQGIAVIGGEPVQTEKLTGVLVRLPFVLKEELSNLAAEDREYAASEMTAFLLSWLTRLACPVLNRPTPMCLAGPAWRPEKWVQAAASLGVPVRGVRRKTGAAAGPAGNDAGATESPTVRVTVIGSRVIGECTPAVARSARVIAKKAGADLLELEFSETAFAGANIWPGLENDEVANAVLDYFSGRRT